VRHATVRKLMRKNCTSPLMSELPFFVQSIPHSCSNATTPNAFTSSCGNNSIMVHMCDVRTWNPEALSSRYLAIRQHRGLSSSLLEMGKPSLRFTMTLNNPGGIRAPSRSLPNLFANIVPLWPHKQAQSTRPPHPPHQGRYTGLYNVSRRVLQWFSRILCGWRGCMVASQFG
jgi:hypothetical protein